jgi:hypothetical protein
MLRMVLVFEYLETVQWKLFLACYVPFICVCGMTFPTHLKIFHSGAFDFLAGEDCSLRCKYQTLPIVNFKRVQLPYPDISSCYTL